ncbi:hypothetical protein ACLOAV_007905 [Pseudogymnoascus australis]
MPIKTIETIIQQDIPRNILPPAYEFDKAEALATLKAFGKYAEAEALQRQTLQLKETVLRKDYPIALGTMMNLATSLSQQGKYGEAETMDQQTLQLQETVLGKDHLALVAYRCRPLLTGQFYLSVGFTGLGR